ncbi:MAG: LCP family protein, partial [Clostridia bacterium]
MNTRLSQRFCAALLAIALVLCAIPAMAEGTFNLLLVGTDSYQPDTPETGDIRLVSFLRDLYVPIPNHGKTRLNAAYFYGGAELLTATLQNNFGVRVDRTMAVNFSLMADLIDQIGGVDVEV